MAWKGYETHLLCLDEKNNHAKETKLLRQIIEWRPLYWFYQKHRNRKICNYNSLYLWTVELIQNLRITMSPRSQVHHIITYDPIALHIRWWKRIVWKWVVSILSICIVIEIDSLFKITDNMYCGSKWPNPSLMEYSRSRPPSVK